MITSSDNPKLRYVRNLGRRAFRAREGRMAIEGIRLITDALDTGVTPGFALVGPDVAATAAGAVLVARLEAADVPVLAVAGDLFTALAETVTPQGIVAVVPTTAPAWPTAADLIVIADGIRDPGNLGTLFRGALAAGAGGLILAPRTVDATNPKVVRSAMGAHFRLPWRVAGWDDIDGLTAGLTVWLADAASTTSYTAVDWRLPCGMVIGGEAAGASEAAQARGWGTIRIPMAGSVASLNAAMAGTVILFEAARQRRLAHGATAEAS